MLGKPKYKHNELVKFQFGDEELIGKIYIIDSFGTIDDKSDVSYDILVDDYPGGPCLVKHIQEKYVQCKI